MKSETKMENETYSKSFNCRYFKNFECSTNGDDSFTERERERERESEYQWIWMVLKGLIKQRERERFGNVREKREMVLCEWESVVRMSWERENKLKY